MNRNRTKPNRKKFSTPSSFESLESRRMMNGTFWNGNWQVLLPATYGIVGTPGHDVITVSRPQPVLAMGFGLGGAHTGGTAVNSTAVRITVNGSTWTANVPLTQRIRIDGMGGNDRITVVGTRGMDLFGGTGNDTLIGGDGDDLLAGGLGTDTVDYSHRMTPVILTCDNRADDGRGGEKDNILSDVEVMIGGQADDYIAAWNISHVGRQIYGNLGNDKLFGSNADDQIIGGGGNDYILCGTGWDYASGGDGNDTIRGGADRDILAGDRGNDMIYADSGNDALFGGDGNDSLYSGTDNDTLYGGRGKDTLVSLGGGQKDVLYGGSDPDFFWLDAESTETIPDYDFNTESKNFQRIANFRTLKVDGVDMGAPSRELNGPNLPDPKALFNYRSFRGRPLFSDAGPLASDPDQGDWVNDCYWLATLGAVAKANPDAIRRVVVDLGDGTFAVRFNDGPIGSQTTSFLRVDADLPTYGDGTPAYAGLGAQKSMWVAVLEKAYAFFRGNLGQYSALDFGDSTEVFKTLGIASTTTAPTTVASLTSSLQQMLSQNKAVTISTKSSATTLVARHQYMVDRVTFDANGNASIRLRNPWGTDGPSADASDDGYVTVSAATLFNAMTRIESATV